MLQNHALLSKISFLQLEKKLQKQNNHLILRWLLVAGEIEISNHSIDHLIELEAFIKTILHY